MKLKKEIIKKGFKNQLISICHMIIFNIISFVVFGLTNIGTKPTGNIRTSSFFGITEYRTNLFSVVFFWIVFLVLFSIFYTKFLKKDLKKQMELHWFFVLLFGIVSVIFCFVEVALLLISIILNIGIFSTIVNFPDVIYILVLAYIIGYIVIDIIREINRKGSANNGKK